MTLVIWWVRYILGTFVFSADMLKTGNMHKIVGLTITRVEL